MQLKGYTRSGKAIVNTDTTKLDLIKQKRAAKRDQNQLASEVSHLRDAVQRLITRVEELERRG